MKTILSIFLFLPLTVCGQNNNRIPIEYGIEIPRYKAYYRGSMPVRSTDSSIVPAAIWTNINNQLDSLTNGLIRRHSRFVRVYVSNAEYYLGERGNPAISDKGTWLSARYRVVRELHLNNSINCSFGFDVDSTGIIIYKNELPFWLETKKPRILKARKAVRKLASVKEVKTYKQGFFYYDPLLVKFVWAYHVVRSAGDELMILVDAVSGKILDQPKLVKETVPEGELKEAIISH